MLWVCFVNHSFCESAEKVKKIYLGFRATMRFRSYFLLEGSIIVFWKKSFLGRFTRVVGAFQTPVRVFSFSCSRFNFISLRFAWAFKDIWSNLAGPYFCIQAAEAFFVSRAIISGFFPLH